MAHTYEWVYDNCGQAHRCKMVTKDEWETLLWLTAEASFKSRDTWPQCTRRRLCWLRAGHDDPCPAPWITELDGKRE